MKSLFDKPSLEEIESRINQLSADTQKKWGKMEVDQMLAHCVEPLSVATDQTKIPRLFIGRLLGPIFKTQFYNDKPLSKNSPTAPQFIISDRRNFETEKERLLAITRKFQAGGKERCTKDPHSFFGQLNEDQWGMGMYKHLDHHLKQFGV